MIYAQVQDSFTGSFGKLLGIWKTTDGGLSWNQLSISTVSTWGNNEWYDIPIAVRAKDIGKK